MKVVRKEGLGRVRSHEVGDDGGHLLIPEDAHVPKAVGFVKPGVGPGSQVLSP